jgi:DNA-binding CsgD family transcriptional regulator
MAPSNDIGSRKSGLTDGLTDRQRSCLLRVAEGRTSKEIAREFAISPSTVDNHINAALKIVGCANRLEAARLVLEGSAVGFEPPLAEPVITELPSAEPVAREESRRVNPVVPTAVESEVPPGGRAFRLPPLGGAPNHESAARRLVMVMQIVLLGLMVGVGAIVSILGVVRLLAP